MNDLSRKPKPEKGRFVSEVGKDSIPTISIRLDIGYDLYVHLMEENGKVVNEYDDYPNFGTNRQSSRAVSLKISAPRLL